MTNDNPIIILRNRAITWISIAVVSLIGAWWIFTFFGGASSPTTQHMAELKTTLELIKKEGVITSKNWDELNPEERKAERWNTMTRLSPTIQKLAGVGTPAAWKNINTMKNISLKVGNENYIPWLEKSWSGDAESLLSKTQSDIAEIIPIFTGISEINSTQDIAGKITLKSLNDYIQTNIVEKYGLANAFGQIGIDRVKFMDEDPEVGVYDIPLHFEKVPNDNVLNLLQFLGKTGGVRITESGKNITIEHMNQEPIKTADGSQSSLKNLLITVKDMNVTPTRLENQDEKSINIVTKTKSLWDVSITLQFYIRGVSRDHIAALDTTIMTLLDKTGGKTSLMTKGNTLLKACNGCSEAPQIRDIINLLEKARAAYDSIILEERDPKKNFSPIDILQHRTDLMTTLETLQKKLETMTSLITPTSV